MKISERIQKCVECERMSCFTQSCPPSKPRKFKGIMIVSFNPLETECMTKDPWDGKHAKVMIEILKEAKISPDNVYWTYLVKGYLEEEKPKKPEIQACSQRFLYREIVRVKPSKIVLLGDDVVKAFVSGVKISEHANQIIEGPHFHAFIANAIGYFYRIGFDSTQYQAFRRELVYFLRHHTPSDITPIETVDQLFTGDATLTHMERNDVVDVDPYEYLQYDSGDAALQQLESFVVKTRQPVGFDIETDRLKIDIADAKDYLISVAVADTERALSIGVDDLDDDQFHKMIRLLLKLTLARPVVGYNTKFDLKLLIRFIMRRMSDAQYTRLRFYDGLYVEKLISEHEGSYKLKDVIFRRYGIPNYADVDFSVIRDEPLTKVRRYNARDAYWTLRLFLDDWPMLTRKQQKICQDIVSDQILCCCFMEVCGLPYNQKVTDKIRRYTTKRIADMQTKLNDIVGYEINTKSHVQVSQFIWSRGWSTRIVDRLASRDKESGECYLSRSADSMSKLELSNPGKPEVKEFASTMLQLNKYRDIRSKLEGTNAAYKYVLEDGRVHCSWWQCQAATFRLSASEPNVLNVERADRLPKDMQANVSVQPRYQYICRKPRILVKADLSQAELRVLTCVSGDEAFTKTYMSGGDSHKDTAADMFYVPVAEVVTYQRQIAKSINFGIVYQQSPRGLYFALNKAFSEQGLDQRVTLTECKQWNARWCEVHSGAAEWIERQKEVSRRTNISESYFGYRRHFQFTGNDSDHNMLRMAVNHPIQNGAAVITFSCMAKIVRYARLLPGYRLVKNEYDAIYSEIDGSKDKDVERLIEIYREGMKIEIGDFDGFITIPFESDIEMGTSIATMEKVS